MWHLPDSPEAKDFILESPKGFCLFCFIISASLGGKCLVDINVGMNSVFFQFYIVFTCPNSNLRVRKIKCFVTPLRP